LLTISGFLSQKKKKKKKKKKKEKTDLRFEKEESCNGFSHKKGNKEMKKTTLVVK